jgi:hypothetical protein
MFWLRRFPNSYRVAFGDEPKTVRFPDKVEYLLFPATYSQTLMETVFLDRLANQLKANKGAACHRAIQRILVRIKKHYESGEYRSTTEAESEFRRLVESDLACK